MLIETQQLLRASSLLLIARDSELKHLRTLLANAQSFNYVLQDRLQEAGAATQAVEDAAPAITFEKQPLYLSDEEEDIKWQLDNDFIDLKTYEALLKELNFQNSEVSFAEEYAAENFHY
jgi:hypothetical protein